MEAFFQGALTADQLAAIHAGGGFARMEDPQTHRVYFLIEQQPAPPTLDDEYVRQKIEEAYAEGGVEPLDMAAIKAEFHRQQAAKRSVSD
jgi:hypothetical protein